MNYYEAYGGAFGVVHRIIKRIEDWQNCLVFITGDPQTAKSDTAKWIGEQISKHFETEFSVEDNIFFDPDDYRRFLTLSKPRGTVEIGDDWGVHGSHRKWRQEDVQALGFTSQIAGELGHVTIVTSPRGSMLEKETRDIQNVRLQAVAKKLFLVFETYVPNLAVARTEDTKFKYMRDTINGVNVVYDEPILFPWSERKSFLRYKEISHLWKMGVIAKSGKKKETRGWKKKMSPDSLRNLPQYQRKR